MVFESQVVVSPRDEDGWGPVEAERMGGGGMGGSGSFNAWRSTSPDNDENLGEVTSRRLLPVKSPATRRQDMSPRAANKGSGITMAPTTTSQGVGGGVGGSGGGGGGGAGAGMLSMSTRAAKAPSGSGVVPYCKPPPNNSLGGQGKMVAPPEGQPREWDVVKLGKMIHIQLDLSGVAAGAGQEGDGRPLPAGASPDPLGLSRGLLSPTSDSVDNLDVEYYVASPDSHRPMPPPSSPASSPAKDGGHQQPARRPGTSHAGAQTRRQGTAARPKKQARGAGGGASAAAALDGGGGGGGGGDEEGQQAHALEGNSKRQRRARTAGFPGMRVVPQGNLAPLVSGEDLAAAMSRRLGNRAMSSGGAMSRAPTRQPRAMSPGAAVEQLQQSRQAFITTPVGRSRASRIMEDRANLKELMESGRGGRAMSTATPRGGGGGVGWAGKGRGSGSLTAREVTRRGGGLGGASASPRLKTSVGYSHPYGGEYVSMSSRVEGVSGRSDSGLLSLKRSPRKGPNPKVEHGLKGSPRKGGGFTLFDGRPGGSGAAASLPAKRLTLDFVDGGRRDTVKRVGEGDDVTKGITRRGLLPAWRGEHIRKGTTPRESTPRTLHFRGQSSRGEGGVEAREGKMMLAEGQEGGGRDWGGRADRLRMVWDMCGEPGEASLKRLFLAFAGGGGGGGGGGVRGRGAKEGDEEVERLIEGGGWRMDPPRFLDALVYLKILESQHEGGLLSRRQVFEVFDQACSIAMSLGDEGAGISWGLFRTCVREIVSRVALTLSTPPPRNDAAFSALPPHKRGGGGVGGLLRLGTARSGGARGDEVLGVALEQQQQQQQQSHSHSHSHSLSRSEGGGVGDSRGGAHEGGAKGYEPRLF